MRVSTIIIVLVIVGIALFAAYKAGYIGQAKQAADSFEAHFQKGQGLYQDMQYQAAIDEFQKAIDRAPNESRVPDAMFKIGLSYGFMGDKAKAIETYQTVIKKYPDNPNRGQVEKALEQAR